MKKASPLVIFQKVLQKVPFTPVDVNCLHCLEYVCGPSGEPTRCPGEVEVRQGTPADLEKMTACQNFPERLPERFASNEHCVVATLGGEVIGYQWFCEKGSRIEERYSYAVEIPRDALYGYDAFVVAKYRRAKIWSRFHTGYLQGLLARLNRRRIIVMVDEGNTASMSAHLRLGYKLYRKVYVAKIFGKSSWFAKTINRGEGTAHPLSPIGAVDRHSGNVSHIVP
jgi:hypothetical protein